MCIIRTLLAVALGAALTPAYASDTPAPAAPADAAAREELRAAREELRTLTRRIAELSARLGAEAGRNAYAFRYLADSDRAMIGVVLGADDGSVVLAGVTPGGPAEKAGLRAGDRIVAINGKRVAGSTGSGQLERALDDDAQVEGARGLIGELKAGDQVRLTYERAGKQTEVSVAAERRESWDWPMWAGNIEIPDFEFTLPPGFDQQVKVIVADAKRAGDQARREVERIDIQRITRDAQRAALDAQHAATDAVRQATRERRSMVLLGGGAWWNLRLAPLNPELGKYFGSDQGVLVLENEGDSLPQLKPGDVLTSIGGRKVDSTPDAMRALVDQEPGAAVNVELLRDRKRQVVVITAPQRRSFELLHPLPPMTPAPPAAPKAPRPAQPPKAPAPPTPPPGRPAASAVAFAPLVVPAPPAPAAVPAAFAPVAAPAPLEPVPPAPPAPPIPRGAVEIIVL